MTKYLFLTGAGFSRNWGCWLGDEVWNAIFGQAVIQADQEIKNLLWRTKADGFEGALHTIRNESPHKAPTLEAAIVSTFTAMDEGLKRGMDSLVRDKEERISNFFHASSELKVDAFFTLNQDLLVERRFAKLLKLQNWSISKPGIKAKPGLEHNWDWLEPQNLGARSDLTELADVASFEVRPENMPYIKLHGAFNLRDETNENVLVVGGGKKEQIDKFPLLKRYFDFFKEKVSVPDTRLLIIGYGFTDSHINDILHKAISEYSLKLYIIDPAGLHEIEQKLNGHPLKESLSLGLAGFSRYKFLEIFEHANGVEHTRIKREYFQY